MWPDYNSLIGEVSDKTMETYRGVKQFLFDQDL